MNRYEPTIPRAGFAFAAVALAMMTFAVTIALPISMGTRGDGAAVMAAPEATAPATLRIDVIGVRDARPAAVPVRAHGKPAATEQVTAVLCPHEARAPAARPS